MNQPHEQTPTEKLLGALLERLQEQFNTELTVELFPESPMQYRLNHPCGAILLAYGRSTFGSSEGTDAVFQARSIVIRLTLVFRQLNGKDGVVSYLDRIRTCLTGWYAPHCDMACRPVSEQFIGHRDGVWQYAQDFSTRATQLQSMVPEQGPPLSLLTFEEYP
ncbi:Gp37 family protein [Pseudomonas frederiksbergensis]|uniref:Gp37 family protein n=1 Tax=Pseudomonas frederiksbergensis TaxID=104087 RepID=UPI0009D6E015|nr:Gp37 family protein [Pseudomonas frederiksbergensis]